MAIQTQAAKTALRIIRQVGFAKRPSFQRMIGDDLGREIGDDEFETIMTQLGRNVRRQRGVGGGIWG
jgi:hypothetical protein